MANFGLSGLNTHSISNTQYDTSLALGRSYLPSHNARQSLAFVTPPAASRVSQYAESSVKSPTPFSSNLLEGFSLSSREQIPQVSSFTPLSLMKRDDDGDTVDNDSVQNSDDPKKGFHNPFNSDKPPLEQIKACIDELVEKGLKDIDDKFHPLELLNRLAEGRAEFDEKHNPVLKTALTVAAMRYAAGVLPSDDITPHLMGPELMFGMKTLVNIFPQLFKELGVVNRTLWIDDRIEQIVKQQGIEQMVNLACGVDARPFRMDALEKVDVIEVDLPEMISAKNALFEEVKSEIGDEFPTLKARSLTRVAADLTNSDWMERIKDAGFDPDKPTLFLVEGLVYYFEPSQASDLASQIREVSSAGSHLLFDCMNQACIEPKPFDKVIGKPSIFNSAIDEPEQWVAAAGFDESVVLQPGDEGANFGLFDEKEVEKKGHHSTFFGTFDRFVHKHPRNEPMADGSEPRRFYFVEARVTNDAKSDNLGEGKI